MPAVECIIKHGDIPADDTPVNEPDILVDSLTITPNRDKSEYKSGRCITGLIFANPTLSFAFDGRIKTVQGLTDQHPGTTVASLLNYTGSVYGFDKADGIMVYEDPSREASTEDLAKAKFTVTQYPFVQAAA